MQMAPSLRFQRVLPERVTTRRYGAAMVVNSLKEDPIEVVRGMAEGRGG